MEDVSILSETILNKDWPAEFPFPTVIRTVVCSDLDETYIPSNCDKKLLLPLVTVRMIFLCLRKQEETIW